MLRTPRDVPAIATRHPRGLVRPAAMLASFALAASTGGSGAAKADSTFCSTGYTPGTAGFAEAVASGTWLCADAGTDGSLGWFPVAMDGDEAAPGPLPVSAEENGSVGGLFSATASAGAVAAPGLLRTGAAAIATVVPPDDGQSFSRGNGSANATFFELGELTGLGGAAPGAPVSLELTIDVSGAFLASGAGDGQVAVFRNGVVDYQRSFFVSTVQQAFLETSALPGFVVGDSLGVWMRLTASAGATNEPPGIAEAFADMGGSGHLYLDVTSGNAAFEATSGHDYSTVPEASGPVLLTIGCLSLRVTRRRRDRVGARRIGPARSRHAVPDAL